MITNYNAVHPQKIIKYAYQPGISMNCIAKFFYIFNIHILLVLQYHFILIGPQLTSTIHTTAPINIIFR